MKPMLNETFGSRR